MPAIEKQFRGIGQGGRGFCMAGRRVGGSRWRCRCFIRTTITGRLWLARIPVDFHAYMTRDLYKDDNMFYAAGSEQARGAAGDAGLPGAHADLDARQHCV
jgi:hypothetical protein